MLRIISAKVTAPVGDGGWIQVHELSGDIKVNSESKGRLYVVVASKNSRQGVEAVTFERRIISGLREGYYNSQEKAFDALKSVTQKTVNEFNTLGEEMEIACVVYAGGFVYTSAYGGCRVLIGRNGSLASILESGNEVIAASGLPKEGDTVVAGSWAFFKQISLSQLTEDLKNDDPKSSIEKITPLIYSNIGDNTSGALILRFESEEQKEKILNPLPNTAGTMNSASSDVKKTNFVRKTVNFLGGFAKKLPKKHVYIKQGIEDEAVSHSRKLTLSVGVILLAILAVSVGFGIRQKRINGLKKEYQGLLTQATEQVNQAISLASTDPEESRNLFLDSEKKLSEIQLLKVKDPKIDELQKMIEDSRAAILGEYLATPELFLDLGLLSSGFKGDAISSSGGNIYILDKNGSRVVSIGIDTKKSKVVAGPTVIENPLDMASYEDNVFVLMTDGIYLVGTNKARVIEKTWGGNALIHAFAGNLYVLDKNANAIYRYAGSGGENYGDQQNWLSSSTRVDFTDAVAWSMDGAIYVLYPNSRILKYSQGSSQSFSLRGITPEIGNVDAMYADPDNQYIYLLDRAGKRVVAVDKNGAYKSQFINDQISEAISLVVSEGENKIILLTGEKLSSIELKGI